MPEPSADKQAELDKLESVDVNDDDDEDGIQTWHIIVGASGLIVIIAIIVFVCYLRKRKNETAIKPMQGSVEMGPRKVPKLQVGSLGDKNNGPSHMPHHVAATDDEKSALDMANPDSFLGSSLTNFNKPDNLKVQIDENGNPQLSPNYAARKKNMGEQNFPNPDLAPTDAESNNMMLPSIGQGGNNGGVEAMKYTMSNFLQQEDDSKSQGASNNGS